MITFGERCDVSALRPVKIGQNSFVYAADGSLLGAIPAERNRQVVAYGQISPWLTRATVAIEDRRFYSHGGVDAEGIARALWRDVQAGRVVEGGSTITQQLVRNLYISNERTVERKITEACLAVKLEDRRSKQWILAQYLNSVFYGNFAYGAEAAARTYFSRSARSLTLPQAALLAGLTQAPSVYDPIADPERALARRNEVLAAMRDQGTITQAQYRFARRSKIGLEPGRLYAEIREPYFFGYVRDELVRAYGVERVRSGGLSVYTTIQPRWQKLAQDAIRGTLTAPDDPAAALISIDPATGAIRAMSAVVPGRANNQFNLLSQARRQPGSTFKTFVLTAAVEQGMDPGSTYYVSAPFTYRPDDDGNCDDGSWWCVKTYDSSYVGWTSVERATLRSDNSVFAQLTLDVGARRVASDRAEARRADAAPGARAVPARDGARLGRRVTARHGVRLRDTRGRRHLHEANRDPEGGLPEREARPSLGDQSPPHARRPGRRRGRRHPDPRGQHPVGDRHPCGALASGRGEDRYDRRARRRVVRRLHAGARDSRVDGIHARRDPDAERPRDRGLGRLLPGRDLAAVHGARSRGPPRPRLPRTAAAGLLPDVGARADGAELRPVLHPADARRARGGRGEAGRRREGARDRDEEVGRRRRRQLVQRRGRYRRATLEPGAAARSVVRDDRGVKRAFAAGAATLVLVAGACALAWQDGSPLVPRDGGTADQGTAWPFAILLAAAFVAYVTGLALLRRAIAPTRLVVVLAIAIQLVPLAAPLLLSTDAWTYWGYGWIGAEGGGNPYVDPPSDFPQSPAAPYLGADWRDRTTVYGPAFTLLSEPVALVSGDSSDVAAWLFKALAAVGIVVAVVAVARVAPRPALAAAFVGWNPVLAVHVAGGGHNDALVGGLAALAVAMTVRRRHDLAGAAWVLAAFVKWIPLVFLALATLAARARGNAAGARGIALAALVLAALGTWSYGLDWLRVLGPLADNAVLETSYALPSRLEQLGVPDGAAFALALIAAAAGLLLLARGALRGEPRLGRAACLLLATTPYLAVWYLAWAVPLAAADEDRVARFAALVLTAYLLPQTIPL